LEIKLDNSEFFCIEPDHRDAIPIPIETNARTPPIRSILPGKGFFSVFINCK
jgi:hypothetical protein